MGLDSINPIWTGGGTQKNAGPDRVKKISLTKNFKIDLGVLYHQKFKFYSINKFERSEIILHNKVSFFGQCSDQ